MKKFTGLFIILFVCITVGLILSLYTLNASSDREVDMLALNHIVFSVAKEMDTLENLSGREFAYHFLVVDAGGRCLYKTLPTLPDTLHASIKQGLIALDITKGGQTFGKVLVDIRTHEFVQTLIERNFYIILGAYLVLAGILAIYFVYVYTRMFKPFNQLTAFAKNIAANKLDTPLPMDKHNIFGAFTESFDVMRVTLAEARRNEQLANQSKKELIASLSHDIKTPTTSIRLIAELLQAQITDSEHIDKLKKIQMKTEQIDRLVNNMLQTTLEELGQLSVNPTDESSAVLHQLFEKINTHDNIRLAPVPPCLIHMDSMRMEQVLDNVVSNSIKYANTLIDVEFCVADAFLKVSIKDYGVGVDSSEIEFLCQKYFRAQKAIQSKKPGEGLGLYIAKLLMNKMDGHIGFINRPDGFTVELLIALSR